MFILNTNITGEPRPSISWALNGRPLDMTANTRVESGAEYSTLTVKGSNAKNGGKYTITAKNEIGDACADLLVKVIGELGELLTFIFF